ncbi:hypothetical protein [Alkalibacillus aidingensis]|uniref:hypothetical protein n=1 Tax=Alkalibacillus aidingensis TaxID=2747607 RepID=UPI0016600BFA|nr:hypothetical protein [Alkalibacillus aidingensis]
MFNTIITLLVVGIILFIISFFMNNRFDELEKELEQLSINQAQDHFTLKNKVKVLEEELLKDTVNLNDLTKGHTNSQSSKLQTRRDQEPPIIKEIKTLYEQGLGVEEIENRTGLDRNDIKVIIQQKSNHQLFG